MSLKQQIDQDIKQAMLARKKEELTALRAVKAAILLAETEKGAGGELDQAAEMRVLTKAVKQRKESAELFTKESRTDLADKEIFEAEIIGRYLPQQLSAEELKAELTKIVAQTGAAGPQDIGKVMGVATKALAGRADGKMISQIVKELLSN